MQTPGRYTKRLNRYSLIKGCIALCMLFFFSAGTTVAGAQEKSADEWQKDFEVYFWLPSFDVVTSEGDRIQLTLRDLLNSLDMMAMVDGNARKGKWSMGLDTIYLNLGARTQMTGNIIGRPETLRVGIDLRAYISTFKAGYQIAESARNRTSLIAGVRYLYLRVPIRFDIALQEKILRLGGHNWNGVVGVEGVTTINDKLYFDYYLDAGAGQADFTWQTKVGIGYSLKKNLTATAGYRYLRWNFDKDSNLKNIWVTGPYVGLKWDF